MIFADKLIMLRKKSGWSQEELAAQMEVSRQSVSKWEGAQSVPDLEKILRMSRLFGVSTDYLLKDELELPENEIPPVEEELPERRRVSMEEASEFLRIREEASGRIALGVFGCILSPIGLLLLGAGTEAAWARIPEELAGGLGLSILLVMIAASVAVFISCGAKSKPFEFLENESFETAYGVTEMVKERREQYRDTYNRSNILGVCICILSAIPMFCGSFLEDDSFIQIALLCLTIVLAGAGVVVLVRTGVRWASMEKLLQEGDYTREQKRKSRIAGIVGSVWWPLTAAVFVGYSFWTGRWDMSWIIWPVSGILYAVAVVIAGAVVR